MTNQSQNKSKSIRVLIVLLLILIIVLMLARVLGKNPKSLDGNNEITKTENVGKTSKEKIEAEEGQNDKEIVYTVKELDYSEEMDVSNWSKYKSDKYGYEISYPNDWELGEKNEEITLISPQTLKMIEDQKALFDGEDYGPWGNDITIFYSSSIEEENINKANELGAATLDELIEMETMEKIGEIKIGDRNATEVTEYGEGTYYSIFIENNRHLYKIFFGNMDKGELSEIEKRILSTFEFI